MKTLVVFNQKGGVGKSTISTNLAAVSAMKGFRTLLVDLDSQCNSTHYVGCDTISQEQKTIAELFKQTVGWFTTSDTTSKFIHATQFQNLDLLPASPELGNIEKELESRYKMYKLKESLAEIASDYDRVFIDTPPSFGFYSKAALIAADAFVIPFDCDHFSAQAIDTLLNNVAELRTDHNRELAFEGIVINQFNRQANLPKELVNELKEKGLPIIDAFLTSSVKIRESHSKQTPIVHFAPKHKLSEQFFALFDALR